MKREKLEAIINDERSSDITKITAELALKDMKIDTIERRIKRQSTCIELWHKVNEDLQGKNSRMRERIKELEDELQVANRCTEDARERIKELEASQPKWISVKDRLPIECENVVCLEDKWDAMSVCWIEYMYEDKRWTDGDRDYPMDYYTHWMPLPQPPKSED